MSNKVLHKLPHHLKNFIITQPYNQYTAKYQAVWRYVMRKNMYYLKEVRSSLHELSKNISIAHLIKDGVQLKS